MPVEGSHRCQREGTRPARVAGVSWTAASAVAAPSIQKPAIPGVHLGSPGQGRHDNGRGSEPRTVAVDEHGSGVGTPAPDTTTRLANSHCARSGPSMQIFTTKRSPRTRKANVSLRARLPGAAGQRAAGQDPSGASHALKSLDLVRREIQSHLARPYCSQAFCLLRTPEHS